MDSKRYKFIIIGTGVYNQLPQEVQDEIDLSKTIIVSDYLEPIEEEDCAVIIDPLSIYKDAKAQYENLDQDDNQLKWYMRYT